MKNTLKLILSLLIIIPILSHAQENKVASKAVNIYSDGTRLSGDVFYPNTYSIMEGNIQFFNCKIFVLMLIVH